MTNSNTSNEGNLVLLLDSKWLTHELSRMFGSIVFLHNFYAVKMKAAEGEISPKSQRSAGWDIYRKANLYYYLESNEKLELKSLQLPEPGSVEFTSRFLKYGRWLLSILSILESAKEPVDNLVSKWYKFKDVLRKQRRTRDIKNTEEKLNTFFSQEIIPFATSGAQNDQEKQQEVVSIINSIHEGLIKLYKSELSDPITTTDHIMTSLATLAYFIETNKILLSKSYISSENKTCQQS